MDEAEKQQRENREMEEARRAESPQEETSQMEEGVAKKDQELRGVKVKWKQMVEERPAEHLLSAN